MMFPANRDSVMAQVAALLRDGLLECEECERVFGPSATDFVVESTASFDVDMSGTVLLVTGVYCTRCVERGA